MNNIQVTAYTIVSEVNPAVCSQKVEELLKDEWVLHGPLNVVMRTCDTPGSVVQYIQAMAKVKVIGPPPGSPMLALPPEMLVRGR